MHIRRAAAVLAGALLISTALTGAAASATGKCVPAWKLMNTPAPPGDHTYMMGAAAPSAKDAWLTGWDAGLPQPWVLHWNGRSLRAAALPQAPFTPRSAYTGSFDSATDGWVVGASRNVTGPAIPYAARWYGGRWTITPLAISPDPASTAAVPQPEAIATLSPSDAWIAGGLGAVTADHGALIEHWDGSSWTIVPNPASSQPGVLFSISAVSATDIWAAGWQQNASGTPVPLAEHWDGTAWSIVPTPTGSSPAGFNAISADGPGDIWAVGDQTEPGSGNLATTFAEHWNGTAWSVVAGLPDLGNSTVTAVYAASPGDLWAVAETTAAPGAPYEFLHWDGSGWTTVPLPGPQESGLGNVAVSLAGTGPGDIWVAGYRIDNATHTWSPMIGHLGCPGGGQ